MIETDRMGVGKRKRKKYEKDYSDVVEYTNQTFRPSVPLSTVRFQRPQYTSDHDLILFNIFTGREKDGLINLDDDFFNFPPDRY